MSAASANSSDSDDDRDGGIWGDGGGDNDDDDDDKEEDEDDDEGDGGGAGMIQRLYSGGGKSQRPLSPFTWEDRFDHVTQDHNSKSRAIRPVSREMYRYYTYARW